MILEVEEKTYIIKDSEDVVLGICKTESRTRALYKCFKEWETELGVTYDEFSKFVSCCRIEELDDIDFYFWDGRNTTKEYESISIDDLRKEIIDN